MPPTGAPLSLKRRATLIALVVGCAVALALVAAPRASQAQLLLSRLLDAVRAAGPWAYFGAMAVLPLPLSWFTVPSGEAFAGQMTLAGVILAALGAMAVQLSLVYWLSRHGLRPLLSGALRRMGTTVPRVGPSDALAVALMVKLTPGPPLFLQCAALALAEVPFAVYFAVSWLTTAPWVVGGVVLGRGILGGHLGLAAAGAAVMAAASAGLYFWRRRSASA